MKLNGFVRYVIVIAMISWTASHALIAEADAPVKWAHSIYAPSYGLDDDRVVTRQSDFAAIYESWPHPVQFVVYPKKSHTEQFARFNDCDEIIRFADNVEEGRWDSNLDRLRFWIQASDCKVWSMMGKLRASRQSYLPDLIVPPESGKTAAKKSAARFTKELLAKVFADQKLANKPFLHDLEFLKQGGIHCGSSSKCRYDVPDDADQTILCNYVAQGDYNGDGINDFVISVFAPTRKSGYIGLIVTRKSKEASLDVIGEY